jgi:hypothetical protein
MDDERRSLHPSTAGEVVAAAFSIYVRHFALLVGIAAIFLLPGPAMGLLDSATAVALAVPLQFVLASAGRLVLIDVASQLCLGSDASVRRGLARLSVGGVAGLIGTTLLASAITMLGFLGPLLLWIPAFFVTDKRLWRMLFGIPFFLLAAGLAINFVVDYFLVGPVVVVERRYGRSALRRSAALGGDVFWRTIAVALVSLAFGIALVAVSVVLRFRVAIAPREATATTMAVAEVFIIPFTTALATLYYHSRCAAHGEAVVGTPEPGTQPVAPAPEEAST